MLNSGDKNGLPKAAVACCIHRHVLISAGPSSSGRTTITRTGRSVALVRGGGPDRGHARQHAPAVEGLDPGPPAPSVFIFWPDRKRRCASGGPPRPVSSSAS